MCDLMLANECLEAIERNRAELQKRYAGGGVLAYWIGDRDNGRVRIVGSTSYDKLADYQENRLTTKERSTSILVQLYKEELLCMY